MKTRLAPLAAALLLGALPASAAPLHFTGSLDYHNDIATISFTLDKDVDEFSLWTDSYLDGLNFDPYATLWTGDGVLIGWSDDDPFIHPATQSDADAGFHFTSFLAGDYILTLTALGNFPLGGALADGFLLDAATPLPISGGGDWSVWIDATQGNASGNGVPEPSTLLLGLLGAGALAVRAARRPR
ncbi:MAG: DVUA0089 family protein [Azoarcus sp.]|nr:DVUA0089 family protein [Azoarcus sp.]